MSIQNRIEYVTNAANDGADNIYLYGPIDRWADASVRNVLAMLNKNKGKAVNVRIHSGGGSVNEGNAIYNALMTHSGDVHIYIDGLAASMASIIAMAGAEVNMSANALLMIHNPSAITEGDANEMRKMADLLDKVTGILADTYTRKTGMAADKVKKMMADETWLTAEEALKMGFVDNTFNGALIRNETALNEGDLNKIFNSFNSPPPPKMEDTKPTPEAKAPAVDPVAAAKIAAMEKELADLRAANAANDETRRKERAELLVENAITAGKITASLKESFVKSAVQDYENTKAMLDGMQAYSPIHTQLNTTSTDTSNGGEDRSKWTFNDWRQKDPEGLERMQSQNPKQFNALTQHFTLTT